MRITRAHDYAASGNDPRDLARRAPPVGLFVRPRWPELREADRTGRSTRIFFIDIWSHEALQY